MKFSKILVSVCFILTSLGLEKRQEDRWRRSLRRDDALTQRKNVLTKLSIFKRELKKLDALIRECEELLHPSIRPPS